jgi:pimeloyl-ACP methyl ester carboxylesterase
LALLRHLNVEKAVIGGLSIGGYITFAVYRHAAQRFRALVLADTRAEPDTPEARAGREQMQAAVREKGPTAAADAMMPKLLRPSALTDPSAAPERDTLRGLMLSNTPQGIIDALETLKTRPDSAPTLSLINVPTLIVVGEEDQATPPPLSEAMRVNIRTAPVTKVVIPNAGHMSNLEQPAAFNAALWSFLRSL